MLPKIQLYPSFPKYWNECWATYFTIIPFCVFFSSLSSSLFCPTYFNVFPNFLKILPSSELIISFPWNHIYYNGSFWINYSYYNLGLTIVIEFLTWVTLLMIVFWAHSISISFFICNPLSIVHLAYHLIVTSLLNQYYLHFFFNNRPNTETRDY